MIKTAAPLAARPISEGGMRDKYKDRVREGKTKRDRESGSHAARFANRDARVSWQKDSRSTNADFPG